MRAWTTYRFGDKVALALPNGETQYLTPESAAELAQALADIATDVDACPFAASTLGTFTREAD